MLIEVGEKIGILTVIGKADPYVWRNFSYPRVRCQCECGKETVTRVSILKNGKVFSCGCTHIKQRGPYRSSEWKKLKKKLSGMKARCYNPNNSKYPNYGGRGIEIYEEWLANPDLFCKWALSNGYRIGLTIERKDVNKGYYPENCEFIEASKQALNKTTTKKVRAFDDEKWIPEWAESFGIPKGTIRSRLKKGINPEIALSVKDLKTRRIEAFGESKNAIQWASDPRCKVNEKTLYARIFNRGWNTEEAITKPLVIECAETSVTAWGESKPIADWVRDKRCRVPDSTLRRRINDGWKPEEAISKGSRNSPIMAWGESKLIAEWVKDERCKTDQASLSYRLRSGWDAEKAISTPPTKVKGVNNRKKSDRPPSHCYEVYGESKTLNEWAKDERCLVGRATLYSRVEQYGWSPERAMTTPSKTHSL